MGSLSSFFGYILNFIYNLVSNYGVAIILFSILLKIILLPLSIKQQKTLIKTSKIQDKIKNIQKKYTPKEGERPSPGEQTKMNQELMAIYKQEGISPFSGCLPTIIQLVLLIAIFGVVRNPLTYMKKIDQNTINNVSQYIVEENEEYKINKSYPQISILKYVSENQDKVIYVDTNKEETEKEENASDNENEENIEIAENTETEGKEETTVEENQEKQEGKEEIYLKDLFINMNFLGLDLNKIPRENFNDYTVYIIPGLYVITSIASMKLTTMKAKKKKEEEIVEVEKVEEPDNEKELIEEKTEKNDKDKNKEEFNMSDQMNKNMSWFMPIMAVSIAIIAPLGLALYWLMNNILMILERLIIGKILDSKKEA